MGLDTGEQVRLASQMFLCETFKHNRAESKTP